VLTGEWQPDSPEAGEAHPPSRDYRANDGDLVCVSHRHHYDPDGIDRVADEDATLVAFEGINSRNGRRDLPRFVDLSYDVVCVDSEANRMIEDTPLWTVPAYNDPDGPRTRANGKPYHPEGRGCGFLFVVDGVRIFWPGDTDVLEGHAALDVDVFLPPIDGARAMSREEAANLAAAMEPELVVPIHYNTFDALEADSEAFVADLRERGIEVTLDEGR
jgi:L-ascorbate metabolism protein UlaG (beta-lactamase superfamily)